MDPGEASDEAPSGFRVIRFMQRHPRWWGLVILGIWTAIFISCYQDAHEDPVAPSTYEAAVSAMRSLPGISCPSDTSTDSQTCTWGQWTLVLTPSSVELMPTYCRGHEQHVVLGGSAWALTIDPTTGATSLPPLSQDEYDAMLDAFNFGNGANWQAC